MAPPTELIAATAPTAEPTRRAGSVSRMMPSQGQRRAPHALQQAADDEQGQVRCESTQDAADGEQAHDRD
nr:hypothetical protein [Saccharopolyspora soli]